jgi:dimethylargininase
MLTAITRGVSPAIARCELSFIDRQAIDLSLARQQHEAYEVLLATLGARILSLPPEPDLADSMFVEDPAIVLDEIAIILPMGTESRRREGVSLAKELSKYRKLAHVLLPGTLEGGDVLRMGRKLFVGLTKRSNAHGIHQLAEIVKPHGYEVVSVPVTGCLHLKSAVTCIAGNTLLANRTWFDTTPFTGCDWIDVDPSEPHAANALALGGTVILPASFPCTRRRLGSLDYRVTTLDISELQKAEAGLTCSSLLFESSSS